MSGFLSSPAWQIVGALLSGQGWVRRLFATKASLDERDFDVSRAPIAWMFYEALMQPAPSETGETDENLYRDRENGDTLDCLDRANLWTGRLRSTDREYQEFDQAVIAGDLTAKPRYAVGTFAWIAEGWRFADSAMDDGNPAESAVLGVYADARTLRDKRVALDAKWRAQLAVRPDCDNHEIDRADDM